MPDVDVGLDIDEEILADCQTNDNLKSFYSGVQTKLRDFRVQDLPDEFISKFIILLLSTCMHVFRLDWKKYASGFFRKLTFATSSSSFLYDAGGSEDVEGKLRLALKTACEKENTTLADLIEFLLVKWERFDVLREIKPFVESLLTEKTEHCCSLSILVPQENENKASLKLERSDADILSGLVVKLPPKTLSGDYELSVFIPHSDVDVDIAKKLAVQLEFAHNCTATLLCNLGQNPRNISKTFHEADFVIPIISSTYLKYINNSDPSDQNEVAKCNLFVFDLMEKEFMKNDSNNFHLVPVLHPETNIEEVWSSPAGGSLFFMCYRLFEDVPEVTKLMKKMKVDSKELQNRRNMIKC